MPRQPAVLSSTEKAYSIIQKAILENKFPHGEFLSQRMLAEFAETSVISLREALRKLEYEGLVEAIPRWGVRIPVETRQSLIDRYMVREGLEVMAAYTVCRSHTEADAARLRALAEACDELPEVDEAHAELFYERHSQFHFALAECTRNPLLRAELERLALRSLLFSSAYVTWAKAVHPYRNWHGCLVEDILSGAPEKAEAAMHAHIQHGLEHDLRAFDGGSA
jgi:DNA-binding GntR family transcriptional regulator